MMDIHMQIEGKIRAAQKFLPLLEVKRKIVVIRWCSLR